MIFIFWLNWLRLGQFAYGDHESEVAFFLARQDFSKSETKNFYINTSNNSLFQETSRIVVSLLLFKN